MYGGDSDTQLPIHNLHRLSRRPPWFLGGLWHRYRLPRGQTNPSVNIHKGRSPVRNISGPAQVV